MTRSLVGSGLIVALLACADRTAVLDSSAPEFKTMPRILMNKAGIKKRVLVGAKGVPYSGIFDSNRGREIAIVDENRIDFFDPLSLEPTHHMQVRHFGGGPPWPQTPLSLRGDGSVHFFAGTQAAALADAHGTLLWKFTGCSVSNAIAVDADHDGTVEFYAACPTALTRLDADGRLVWATSTPGPNWDLLHLPAEDGRPDTIVTEHGMFTSGGKNLGQPPWPVRPTYLHALRWRDHYVFAAGESTAEGGHFAVFDVTGHILFRQTMAPFNSTKIWSVRLGRHQPDFVVVEGTQQVGRGLFQLSMFTDDRGPVYQELREKEALHVVDMGSTSPIDRLLAKEGNTVVVYELATATPE